MTLEAEGLTVGTRLREVSLSLPRGAVTVVMGRNGAGKSTLIDACLGRVAASGRLSLDGRDPRGLPPRERAAQLAWLPQQGASAEGLSAREVVEAARYRFAEGRALCAREALRALGEVGAQALCDRPFAALSGGERQRVRMAALVAQDASFWLLDEPANHLDPRARLEIWEQIGSAARAGRGVLVVTHEVSLLPALQEVPVQVIGLSEGRRLFALDREDPSLANALGALLGLRVVPIDVEGERLIAVLGRA